MAEELDATASDGQGRETLTEQLTQVQKMEALGTLTAGMAHDINNMLGAIMGHASNMIQQLDRDHHSYPDAEQILKAARRVKRLTDRLLAFSRHPEHTSEPLSLSGIVMDVMGLLARTLPKSIVFKTRLAKNIGAESDRARLEHLLLNLCLNARDALADGGEILIQTYRVELDEQAAQPLELQPGIYSVLSVKDNGQGMEPDVLSHALDPFFTTRQEGSGLGLTLVEATARQYGGRITIDSMSGKGTEVKVFLPFAEGPFETRSQPPAPKELVLGQGETILLVDDERHLRQMAKRLLE
jgi:signal transduction histidine kinase